MLAWCENVGSEIEIWNLGSQVVFLCANSGGWESNFVRKWSRCHFCKNALDPKLGLVV